MEFNSEKFSVLPYSTKIKVVNMFWPVLTDEVKIAFCDEVLNKVLINPLSLIEYKSLLFSRREAQASISVPPPAKTSK